MKSWSRSRSSSAWKHRDSLLRAMRCGIVAVAHNIGVAVSATIGVETRASDKGQRQPNRQHQPNREARIEWIGVPNPERTCKIRVGTRQR